MAKLKTEKLVFDGTEKREFAISFDINVNKDGSFTTTIPSDIVKLFEDASIDVSRNQLGNKGYFTANTYDGLVKKVKDTCLEYMSREMILEKVILKYCIQTRCSYAFDKDGVVIPNPSATWSGVKDEWDKNRCCYNSFAKWIEGTVDISSNNNSSFGFLIYAEPMIRWDWKYKSGKVKIEYTKMCYGGEIAELALEDGYFLRWLNDVPCITMPPDGDMKEMDYSESVCEFFVGIIKSVAMMNEKIKDFLEPEAIQMIAEKKMKFLE
jgi:hypothetical protein